MPNSADKSPEPTQGDNEDANSMSDPDLDDLGLAMPEFRVPTRSGASEVSEASADPADAEPTDGAGAPAKSDEFVDEPTHSVPVDDLVRADADTREELAGITKDDLAGISPDDTHKVDVDGLLAEDRSAGQNAGGDAQEGFDRAELVKTVRMDAFDRSSVEAAQSWEIMGFVSDQRYAPDVLILPPRVLTKKWQDGASVRRNGASAAARPSPVEEEPQDRSSIAPTVRTSPLPEQAGTHAAPQSEPDVESAEPELELDSEAIMLDEVAEHRPPPKPAGSPDRQRPGRVRRNTGPLEHSETAPSPQSQQDDDDLSGIVQELLEEKKAKAEKPAPKKKQAGPKRDEKRINWFNDVFTEEYFRTLPKDFHKQTERDAKFIHHSLGLQKGARLLDLACGFGRHAVELAARDYEIAGLDVSMAMLQRALNEAQRRGLSIKFVHGDMRELNFNGIFDACFCWQTSFGYFDDRTNVQVAKGIARALKPGGRFLLDVVNRDYVVGEMPSRTWWEGHECVFLEEVEFDNHFSVLHTKRSFIYEDGSPPREFSSYIRLYSLHELRQLLHFAGFRVLEVSGNIHHRGSFLGPSSPRIILLAERVVKDG